MIIDPFDLCESKTEKYTAIFCTEILGYDNLIKCINYYCDNEFM